MVSYGYTIQRTVLALAPNSHPHPSDCRNMGEQQTHSRFLGSPARSHMHSDRLLCESVPKFFRL